MSPKFTEFSLSGVESSDGVSALAPLDRRSRAHAIEMARQRRSMEVCDMFISMGCGVVEGEVLKTTTVSERWFR